MGLSATDIPAGGGTCKNNVTHAATRRHVNSHAEPEIGAFESV